MTDEQLRAILGAPDADLVKLAEEIRLELVRRDVCEHGVSPLYYCPDCREEYRRARIEAGWDE